MGDIHPPKPRGKRERTDFDDKPGEGRVDRSAFLYLPKGRAGQENGQCASCWLWAADMDRCLIHGPKVDIDEDDSCGLYVPGKPRTGQVPLLSLVTPEQSGLVDRKVRCEHCRYERREATQCGLYAKLNDEFPDIFDLDEEIDPQGCCNAQMP